MQTRHLKTPRTARYHLLGDPGGAREAWFVCHGYAQLAADFLAPFGAVAEGRVVVAPEALSRFYVDPGPGPHGPEHAVGATWMTRVEREVEIADYVRYLDRVARAVGRELPGGRPERTLVLGFSQGVHTATRWVVLGRRRTGRLVLWGASLPRDLDPARATRRLRAWSVVLVRGEEDGSHAAERVEDDRRTLEEWGVGVEVRTHPGGHRLNRALLARLARGEGA